MAKQPYLRSKIYSIYKPSLGLVQNEPSSILNPRASKFSNNVRYEDGEVKSRYGYSDYGTGTITGVPLKFYDFNETLMMATTTNVYYMVGSAWTNIVGTIGCDADNRISMATYYHSVDNDATDKFYCVWGSKDYLVKKWNATDGISTLASDVSTWKPKVIVPYQYRLLMFNIMVGTANKPIRMSYNVANDIDDWTSTGSASRNLTQGMGSEIMNAVPLKNYLGIYKDRSITLLSYVGGTSIFATQVPVDGVGLMAQDAIVNLGTKHIFLGNDYNIYQWEGGGELIPIGDPIRYWIKADIYRTNKERCFATHNKEEREVLFFVPSGSADYATVYYTYNYDDKSWSRNTIAETSTAGELWVSNNNRTMIGLSGGGTELLYMAPNDDGAAVDCYFETPDITCSPEEHLVQNKNFKRVIIEARGTAIIMKYSTDGGENWSDADTQTLDSTTYYGMYSYYFAKTARQIRFRFQSTAADAQWRIRYIGIEYKERERK